jgi:hypothetical protein
MVRGALAFGSTRLGGADVELAIHRDRIAIDDFTVEFFGKS